MKTLLRLLAIAAIIAQTPIHAAPILWSSASGGNDHYYDITPDRMNWDAAESFAVSRGGHLVSIQSGAEQAFLASTFLSSTDDHRIAWIGINDVASEGSFIWSSGEPVTYNNWNVSEPNNFGDEDYGVINWNYGNNHPGATPATWNDVHVNGTTTPQNPNQALPYFGIYEYSVGVSITSHPQPLTLNTGETATFTVAATGSGALTYQWQKDGADMPGKTSPTLTLSNVQPQNVGYYLCKVSSLSGAVPSKQVTLSINGVDFGVWQGLVAYYQFNGNAIDSTGHGFDGVPAGAVSAIDRNGAAGAAYRLNGSSFVDFPQFPTLGDRGAQFTISLWVKAESTGPIFGDYEGSMTEEDSTFAVQIGVDSNSAESPLPNFLSITSGLYYEVSSDFTHFIGNSPMVGSGWRHIVYQMDGVGSCRTFVDGTRVGSRPYLANRSYVEAPRWRAGNILAAGQQQYFTGSLDDIRIYNRALSDTEVLQLYSSEGGQGFGPVSQTWVQRYDGPDALNDYGVAVAVDSSSNVVVTGISHSIGGLDDIFTAKYAAANGALIWLRRYNGPASGNDRGHCIAVDSFGDVIVCGTSADFGGTEDFYTAKYAALDGSLIWEKRYDGPPSGADIVNAVVLDPDGNVIVTGKSFNGANFDFTTVKYALLDGAVLWEQRYDGPAHGDDIANAVAVDGQGDVVVAGQSASEGGDLDFCTVKYRGSDGMLIWDHRKNRIDPHFGGVMNAEDILRAVAITPSGDVVVTGSSGRYPWTTDYYIAEYSGSDGELIWDSFRNFIGGGIGEDGGTSVVIDPQGNIVATGYATTNTSSAASYYTIKYQDQTGHAFWEREYRGTSTSYNGFDIPSTVCVDSAGNVYVTGSSRNLFGDYDYATISYSPEGDRRWERRYNGPSKGHDQMNGFYGPKLALSADGGIVVTGQSENGSDFDSATVKYVPMTPVIATCPPDRTLRTISNSPTVVMPDITVEVVATDDVGVVSVEQTPAAGTLLGAGTHDVAFTATDALGNYATCHLTLTVIIGHLPVARNDSATAGTNGVLIDVLANDGDDDADPLTISAKTNGAHGLVTISGDGRSLSYDPEDSFVGADSFTYTIRDPLGGTATATVSVMVTDTQAPSITLTPTPQTVNTGSSPTAPLPDIAAQVSATDNVAVVSNTQLPLAGTQREPGVYEVVVTVSDAAGLTAQTTVQVTVRDDAAPVFTAIPPSRSIRAATDQASIAAPDLTGEASATDNIGVIGITQSPPAGSPLAVGVRTIVLTATDAQGNSSTTPVLVTVLLGNRTPVAGYDSAFAMSRTLTLDVLANDSDADGDPISIVSFTQPQHGTVTQMGNSLRFDPDLLVAVEGESFTYTISDGEVTATATVEIAPIPEGRRFSGVLEDAGGPCGLIIVAFTSPGYFDGYVNKDGIRHRFRGGMSTQGFGIGDVTITLATRGAVTLRPGGVAESGERRLLLGFTGVAVLPTTEYFVEQSPFSKTVLTPQVGQFAVALKRTVGSQSSGYAVIKVASNGATIHVGKAPNGQAFSSSGQLLSGGRIGIHGALGAPSSRRGYLAGMMNLDVAGNAIDGAMRWKLPIGRDIRFPSGLDTPLAPIGDRLPFSRTPMGLFGSTVPVSKTLEFSESVFPSPVLASVTFGGSIKSTMFDAPITLFSTYPSSGKILGNTRPFGPTGARFIFDGIVLPLRGEVYGSMRSATKISAIRSQ